MNPKDGKAGKAVAPAAPDEAEEADIADPGKIAELKAEQIEKQEGKYGATQVTPHKPPEEDEDEAEEKLASKKHSAKKEDRRLHGNPQHRLNPILRAEMERRGIDSGETSDLELAEKLKGFDYGKSASRIQAKLNKLNNK